MTDEAPGLTRRGWAVLALAAVMVAAGILFGIKELYPVAAAALVLVLAARGWVAMCTWDLRTVRVVRPSRVPAGADARVELAVSNRSRRRSPVVTAVDTFDGGSRAATFLVAPLEPGESRAATYGLPTHRRGLFHLGPLQLELHDPFGLARVRRRSAPVSPLTVHPRIEVISADSLPNDTRWDTTVPVPVRGQGGDEFYGLRQYREGDDLRLVHWASTARVDELMVREPENLWRGRLTIVADLRSDVHSPSSIEASLSAVASILFASLHAGLSTRLVTTSGADSGFVGTRAQAVPILDLLASAQTHPGDRMLDGVRVRGRLGPFVLVTTSATSETDLASIVRTGGSDRGTLVIFDVTGATGIGPGALPARARVVLVPHRGSFVSAWEGTRC